MTRRVLIAGASRGIGAALARELVAGGDEVITLSRKPAAGTWIACDLAESEAIRRAAAQVEGPLDALVFVAGIWEENAFSPQYDFATRPWEETQAILDVNLRAPILLAQALIGALQAGNPGRIVLIGSTSGLENIGSPEVAYNASKAGLRGAGQALAAGLGSRGIPVSVINPGDVATEAVVESKASGRMAPNAPLAISDVLSAIHFALNLSRTAVSTEINLVTHRG